MTVTVALDPNSIESYRLFLRAKALPRYRIVGRTVEVPDEYADLLGVAKQEHRYDVPYTPEPFLFDYQRDIARLAVQKEKFAVFADPGLGKTLILLSFAKHAAACLPLGEAMLIVSPLMVVRQTVAECRRFYGDSLPIEIVRAADLQEWLRSGTGKIGITNYEALTEDIRPGRLGGLAIDESSSLKSSYGKWGQRLVELGKGLRWKLCLTGTPAPNDRIEYATHAVFLDQFTTTNAFLSRFFVNRGETQNRWELKPHALRPFYRALSHWCIFLTDPAVYGWKDNVGTLPPIHVHIHDVPLTDRQQELAMRAGGDMFGTPQGIASRAKIGQIAKGHHNGEKIESLKPAFIRELIESWPEESTIVWCLFNKEQDELAEYLPDCASIDGSTPESKRIEIIEAFQAGRIKRLLTKAKVLGFGLNLQIATRHIFSGLADSYEMYWQAIKRSNRVGSTRDLNVHIPITPIERPMVDTVLRKAHRVELDTKEQERLFKEVGYVFKGS